MSFGLILVVLLLVLIAAALYFLVSISVCLEVQSGNLQEPVRARIELKWFLLSLQGSLLRQGGQTRLTLGLWGRRDVLKGIEVRGKVPHRRSGLPMEHSIDNLKRLTRLLDPLGQMVRRVNWKEVRIHGEIGFDDPALTGWLTGIVCAFDSMVGSAAVPVRLELEPDFEQSRCKVISSVGCSFRPYQVLSPMMRIVREWLDVRKQNNK